MLEQCKSNNLGPFDLNPSHILIYIRTKKFPLSKKSCWSLTCFSKESLVASGSSLKNIFASSNEIRAAKTLTPNVVFETKASPMTKKSQNYWSEQFLEAVILPVICIWIGMESWKHIQQLRCFALFAVHHNIGKELEQVAKVREKKFGNNSCYAFEEVFWHSAMKMCECLHDFALHWV